MVATLQWRKPGTKESLPFDAVTKQHDWEHLYMRDSDLLSVVTSCKSVN
jgi:hypothetical protein